MVAVGRLPMLKVFNFFSQIIIISYMRIKLTTNKLSNKLVGEDKKFGEDKFIKKAARPV